jgi:hypothetical protein
MKTTRAWQVRFLSSLIVVDLQLLAFACAFIDYSNLTGRRADRHGHGKAPKDKRETTPLFCWFSVYVVMCD